MKKSIFFFIIIAVALSLQAQEPAQFTMKLDSVVGSDDFGWSQWKRIFTYYNNGSDVQDDLYRWEDGKWKLAGEVDTGYDTVYCQQIQDNVVLKVGESGSLERVSRTVWEYDDLNRLTRATTYLFGRNSWIEDSKYEYVYNEEGLLDTCFYSFIKNGDWFASRRTIYTYDENQLCVGLLTEQRGDGWGPMVNTWRISNRYEFEYENGELLAELLYTPISWFGQDVALDSKWEYEFDANGNMLRKTGSIYNEEDWIVRDEYQNRYDASIDASNVMGLIPFWLSMGDSGMNYATGAALPLHNLWLSCSITSSEKDTQFQLYCSGFAAVDEADDIHFNAYSSNGKLVVEQVDPSDITVYDLLGRQVASEQQVTRCEIGLRPGLYIVSNGLARVKVMVK